jgi:MSHA biogenesis protein MshO
MRLNLSRIKEQKSANKLAPTKIYSSSSVGSDLSAQSRHYISPLNTGLSSANKFAPTNYMLKSRNGGFTLVELILVIIILGIVSIGTVQYLSLGAQIYADATERDEAVAQSRFMLARLTRELRHATPNSVRVKCSTDCSAQQCLEFTPFKASTIYTGNITDDPFTVVSPQNDAVVGDWLSVYALTTDDVYNRTKADKRVAELSDITAGVPTSTWEVTTPLTIESPTKRLFVLDNPVSFCIDNTKLYRFEGYSVQTAQSMPNSSNQIDGVAGILLGQFIQNSVSNTSFFNYNTASLTRNSVVNIRSEMGFNSTETVSFNHEIHLPNVP